MYRDEYGYERCTFFFHQQPLNSLMLTDMRGNRMLAKQIFTASIKAIKDQLLKSIATAGRGATEHEIRWVLTVPAIWRDDAKQFMRQCAEKVYTLFVLFHV